MINPFPFLPHLELPGHGEGEASIDDFVPRVGKAESVDVKLHGLLGVDHVVVESGDEVASHVIVDSPFVAFELVPRGSAHRSDRRMVAHLRMEGKVGGKREERRGPTREKKSIGGEKW